jgi:formylglycine-generating enzyme required for sulfatase activity
MTVLWAILAAVAAQEVKTETVTIPDLGHTFEMVRIPGGKVKAGDREIEVRPFWISKDEVAWEAFEAYFSSRKAMKLDGVTRPSQPYEPPNGHMGTGRHPAIGMRWHGAMGYCDWLSAHTHQRFRLPTEAEWEYAARAGDTGAAPANISDVAWCKENGGEKTHPAGEKKANAFGLHDMLGNVWEYCLEPFAPPDFGPVLRGGAWNTPGASITYSFRQQVNPDWYDRDPNRPRSMWWLTDGKFAGFRIVRFIDPAREAEQKAAADKVTLEDLKIVASKGGQSRVTGKVTNGGGKAIEELELTVFYLDAKGQPLFEDKKVRPSYTKAYPVLLNSWHDGPWRKPLGPGDSRTFEVDVPVPYDLDDDAEKVSARVSSLEVGK